MPPHGKHRRNRISALKRGLATAGTGLAVPMIAVSGATAAPAPKPPSAETSATAASGTTPADPAKAAPEAKGKAQTKAKPKAKPKSGHRTHVVKRGETLATIAHAEGIGLERLYKYNARVIGPNRNMIRPGLVLTLLDSPAPHPRTGKAPSHPKPAPQPSYGNDCDGWINQSLAIMDKHGIPGTFAGIKKNVMRESSCNPHAENNWDSNARAGQASVGLLQIIPTTFQAHRLPELPNDRRDPVANIVAASRYAASRYGSIDNVNGPY
ncbi:transglycosylase SLT domain-containing protein [Streptomyces sp. NBC_00096]|uniref:transglycosylase SLT domain-containing protein n=1 Tax=Streptomyces sp. NBC_00096 TaxID=2975650 RepID=UPI00324618F0